MSKKYNRTYHLPSSPGTTSDDRIAEDVSGLLGREIVILEKLDGENNAQTDLGTYARSHAAFTTSAWSREVRILNELIRKDIPENLMIFGENMEGIHAIEYLKLESYFYMFGAREDEKRWYSWQEVEDTAFLLDLKVVPVLFKGICNTEKELYDTVDKLAHSESKLGGVLPLSLSEKISDTEIKRISVIEGCVVRITDSFDDEDFSKYVMKWVRKNHVNKSITTSHWTRNWKKASLINR